MKRFSVLSKWNERVAERIRLGYEKHYGVDLKQYIPNEGSNFSNKWNELITASFSAEWFYIDFKESSIKQLMELFVKGEIKEDIILNAVNRYDFYEADIWISAAYTIRYLKSDATYKQKNIKKWLLNPNAKQGDKIYNDEKKEEKFCRKLLHYLVSERGFTIFEDILLHGVDSDQKFLSKRSDWDVTRWSWARILKDERDIFYSKIISEKEYQDKLTGLKTVCIYKKDKSKGFTVQYGTELEKLQLLPNLEDYILYWKLTGGELVRRFLPLFHMNDELKMIIDLGWLEKLCCIESISWQIILIEIYKVLNYESSEIDYPFCEFDTSIYLPNNFRGTQEEYRWLKEIQELYLKKVISLNEWETQMIEIKKDEINENRRLLVEAMVYLYMSSDEKIQGEILEIIQGYAKEKFEDIQTPSICEFKNQIQLYVDGKLEIDNDILTDKIIDDLLQRHKEESADNDSKQKKKKSGYEKLISKIRLRKNENDNSLTVRYILLQRIMIRALANHNGLSNLKNYAK